MTLCRSHSIGVPLVDREASLSRGASHACRAASASPSASATSGLQIRAAEKVSVDVEVQPLLLNIEQAWFFWVSTYFWFVASVLVLDNS